MQSRRVVRGDAAGVRLAGLPGAVDSRSRRGERRRSHATRGRCASWGLCSLDADEHGLRRHGQRGALDGGGRVAARCSVTTTSLPTPMSSTSWSRSRFVPTPASWPPSWSVGTTPPGCSTSAWRSTKVVRSSTAWSPARSTTASTTPCATCFWLPADARSCASTCSRSSGGSIPRSSPWGRTSTCAGAPRSSGRESWWHPGPASGTGRCWRAGNAAFPSTSASEAAERRRRVSFLLEPPGRRRCRRRAPERRERGWRGGTARCGDRRGGCRPGVRRLSPGPRRARPPVGAVGAGRPAANDASRRRRCSRCSVVTSCTRR